MGANSRPILTIEMHRKFLCGVLLIIFVSGGVEAALRMGWLNAAEDWYYDVWHHVAGLQYQPRHVVIVAIDDQTRLEHQDEPLVFWGPHFARALEVLRKAGVKVVGLDYLFSVSAESWLKRLNLPNKNESRIYDVPLRAQLAAGQVVLASNMVIDVQGKRKILLPIWDYWNSLPGKLDDVGLTNFYNDPDGTIRQFSPVLADDNHEIWGTFALLLAERSGLSEPLAGSDNSIRCIRFAGPPGTFPRISFRRLLTPEAESDPDIMRLKGKVVIIASESSMQHDTNLTPYARGFLPLGGRMMSGAELHANIVETLLLGQWPRPVSPFLRLGYLVVILAIAIILFFRLSPWQGLAAAGLLGLVCTLLAYLLFRASWILPVLYLQSGLLISYLGVLGVRLTGEERERTELREIFGRYVADEVVEKLLNAKKRPDLGGDAYQVTVLFADIRNFTTISELLTPHETVEMLNTYFSRACEPILEQGGTLDKFVGDALMAVFGSPVPYPDHARRAIAAALAMTEMVQEFRAWMTSRFLNRGLPDFAIGIGLHTGEAIVGNIGSPKRLDFTAIGDTVNAASRLEGLTKELGWAIVASRNTIEAASPGVMTGGNEKMLVKGRKQPIEVFEVLGLI